MTRKAAGRISYHIVDKQQSDNKVTAKTRNDSTSPSKCVTASYYFFFRECWTISSFDCFCFERPSATLFLVVQKGKWYRVGGHLSVGLLLLLLLLLFYRLKGNECPSSWSGSHDMCCWRRKCLFVALLLHDNPIFYFGNPSSTLPLIVVLLQSL